MRCPQPGDGQTVYEAVAESIESLRSWPASLPWAMYEPSPQSSETYCRQSAEDFDNRAGFVFLVFLKNGTFIGSVGLHDIDWFVPKMEIGFWLRSSARGQGYAQEAVSAVVDFAFDQLRARRVEARTDEDNHACRATCISAALQLEGILRHERITPTGQPRNTCVYAAIRGV